MLELISCDANTESVSPPSTRCVGLTSRDLCILLGAYGGFGSLLLFECMKRESASDLSFTCPLFNGSLFSSEIYDTYVSLAVDSPVLT